MIKFSDFFKVEFPVKTKVKFNMNNGSPDEPAWDLLRAEEDSENYKKWLEMNAYKKRDSNNNLNNAEYLLSFAQYYPLGPQYYIFGGMYKVEKIIPELFYGVGYNLTLLEDFKEYRKRLIIKLKKPIGNKTYNRKYISVQNDLEPEIYELLPNQAIEAFPGFYKVLLNHKQLEYIYAKNAPEWEKQLSSVKAVYCITDTKTGKLYVGSACGDCSGLWQRWKSYADLKNLTGGNKFFTELKFKNKQYIIDNFTYAILEVFDPKTSNDEILQRESFWKDVFKSKKFGMNKN